MKNFDLYTELMKNGFEAGKTAFGSDVLTKEWIQEPTNTFYGNYSIRIKVEVLFNSDHSNVKAYYYDGGREPFKTKVHLNDKRAFNAIRQTVANNGFEL